ncbi:integrase [Caballeronia zhejiangensis]|uniref:integrase n=1 Tax=Caballeronia zhejiangensis TaxID=871203 RepID=UPI001EF58DDB|nr:integrase [Caballeronia zhejiangensis]MCG7400579.1 integrase [Caballeronia zhejiangensis]
MTAHVFEPLSKASAEQNLAAYIAHARNEVVAFGVDLDFGLDCWDVTAHCRSSGERRANHGTIRLYFSRKQKDGGQPLSDRVRDFAKAYVRSEVACLSSIAQQRAIEAFRALDLALDALGLPSICDCDATTFDSAVALLLPHVGAATMDAVGPRLGQIARFMDERGLCRYPLGSWRYQKQRACTYGRVGEEFEARKLAKMPSQDALDALAAAFRLAIEPRDVLPTSVAAILCSAPERINEVMALPENCEVEQIGTDGKRYLGLRWPGSKGYGDHVKLILPGMADVVREALRKIREVTAPARSMALWYEQHPTQLFLPPGLEHLRAQEFLDFLEIASLQGSLSEARGHQSDLSRRLKAAGIEISTRPRYKKKPESVVRFADFERHVVSMLPGGFPVADAKTGLKFSDALLVMPLGLFRAAGSKLMFESLRYHHVSNALGQNAIAGSSTVFQRLGLDPDRRLFIKTHQFRHWLNTLAQGASLSQVDIAKWSGRASIHQNAAYDHESSDEIVQRIRDAIGDHGKAIGSLAEIPNNLPVSHAEFVAMAVPTAHVTLYGFCIHDFTSSPCEMFRKCLDCREHVCVKGLSGRTERVRQALGEARHQQDLAVAAVADGIYGADEWVDTHGATVERLEQLLTILLDPSITDGAVIQSRESGVYSLSEAAIRDRGALADQPVISLLEPRSTAASISP